VLRVVFDTNIYISAYAFGGVADKVVQLAQTGEVSIAISRPILHEIERVLRTKFHWPEDAIVKTITNIRKFTYLVIPTKTITIITTDPPDNRILECAVEANAELIISGDNDLKRLKTYQKITIISPKQFLEGRWLQKVA
jgi:uncharacterized protein